MKVPFLIIGGGLSGLAAAIRISHYCPDVVVLEQHSRVGGLNSYYYRNKCLIETGLHAITNFATQDDKKAPINRLFRQLKIKRKNLNFLEQKKSEIHFKDQSSLFFNNDIELLKSEISAHFPHCIDSFNNLLSIINEYDPFKVTPFISTKSFLQELIADDLLIDMLLCPLLYYGSSVENDMDLNQFVIMFKSIYLEGMFRPEGSMKDFLQILLDKLQSSGGQIRLQAEVQKILHKNKKAYGVELTNGEIIECENILSTAGYEETLQLLGDEFKDQTEARLGFVESIFLVDPKEVKLPSDKTIIFFNDSNNFNYQSPNSLADVKSGVICFPQNFQNLRTTDSQHIEVRLTHLANFSKWQEIYSDKDHYLSQKKELAKASCSKAEKIIGNFSHNIVYQDTFTPVTIKRYTSKINGAIYGSPIKIKDGDIGYSNLYLAGTDQGFLGIIGSMLSGVSIANQHFLPKI